MSEIDKKGLKGDTVLVKTYWDIQFEARFREFMKRHREAKSKSQLIYWAVKLYMDMADQGKISEYSPTTLAEGAPAKTPLHDSKKKVV